MVALNGKSEETTVSLVDFLGGPWVSVQNNMQVLGWAELTRCKNEEKYFIWIKEFNRSCSLSSKSKPIKSLNSFYGLLPFNQLNFYRFTFCYFMILIKLSDTFVFSQPFLLCIQLPPLVRCVQMRRICRGNGPESARQSGKAGQKKGGGLGGRAGHNLGCVCVLSIPPSPG